MSSLGEPVAPNSSRVGLYRPVASTVPTSSHLLLLECSDRAAKDFSFCNGLVAHPSFDISVGWMDELAWGRAGLGGWKEPLKISSEPCCGGRSFAYSWMRRSHSWDMSPTYCAARGMALRAFSLLTSKADQLMERRNTQKSHAWLCFEMCCGEGRLLGLGLLEESTSETW